MPTVTTDLSTVLTAATALERGARFNEALDLLDSVVGLEGHDRMQLLMIRAEVVARRDHVLGSSADGRDEHPLDEVLALARQVGTGPTESWDISMLALRRAYSDAMVREDGSPWFGPEGRDLDEVDRDAGRGGPAPRRGTGRRTTGWALMCLGWFNDNLRGDRVAAPASLPRGAGRRPSRGDDPLVFEAQRHLGDHAHDDGDHQGAVAAWAESTEAAARAGYLSGVLAQQLLLAVLARDAGDEAGARALAVEIGRVVRRDRRDPAGPAGRGVPCRASTPPARRRRPPPPVAETAVPYSGTAGLRDDARSGERLPLPHAP